MTPLQKTGTIPLKTVIRMVENICPKKKQVLANVCLARNTMAWRIEDVASDIKIIIIILFFLAWNENTDSSDTA